MTANLPRGPSPLNSALTTSQSRTSNISQQPGRMDHRKNAADVELIDASNDKSTVALIRRVLCPDASAYGSTAPRPLQDLLPPLTSSNDVDVQLYALIAVLIKDFVYSWYAKITPDHIFVDEVLQLIAHCTRALEQRLRAVDVEQLVLDEVTGIVQAHVTAYRITARGSCLVSVKSSTRDVYHKLNPHPGLSPVADQSNSSQWIEQQENERLYRHLLIQGVLAVLLPTEDLENVCLRTLVEDVLSDLILGNEVGGKICEGWFIWLTISKVISLTKQKDGESMFSSEKKPDPVVASNRLERFGLLSDEERRDDQPSRKRQSKTTLWVWKTLFSLYLAYVTMRFIIEGLLHTAFSNPEASIKEANKADHLSTMRLSTQTVPRPVLSYRAFALVSQVLGVSQRMPWLSGFLSLIQSLALTGPGKLGDTGSIFDRYLRDLIGTYVLTPTILPVLLFTARATLFPSNSRPNNAPSSSTSPGGEQVPPRTNDDNSNIPQHLQTQMQHLLSAKSTDIGSSNIVKDEPVPAATLGQGSNNNTHSSSHSPAPSASEVAAIKRQCAADILSLIPESIARAFFRGADHGNTTTNNISYNNQQQQTTNPSQDNSCISDNEMLLEVIEHDLLDPFSDAYCNKHLIFAIIEMVLVRLIPELSEHSISGLMEERGVVL